MIVLPNLTLGLAFAGRSEDQFRNAYTFPSFHERILAPYDYYEFGQRYVRQLVDFERSVR